MKLEFQAKFLQHLNKKKQQDEGFTLIELLVVIIIIGILAAIALPSLLSQVNKGKQAEAKQNVGSMNRSQQAYFLENDQFATSVSGIGIGIKTQTVNYYYTVTTKGATDAKQPEAANNVGAANQTNVGVAKKSITLKSYIGQNFTTIGDKTTSEVLTLGFLCETLDVGPGASTKSLNENVAKSDSTGCGAGYKDLSGQGKKQ
jgi:type IV pilus assembly protein PilA